MATEVILPVLGDTMDKGTIVEWLVQEGQSVEKGQPLYQIETDKAILAVEAPASGVLHKIFIEAGTEVPVLTVVGLIAAPGEDMAKYNAPSAATGKAAAVPTNQPGPEDAGTKATRPGVSASPRARKAAAARGVDLALVQGSGPGGRIVEQDVLAYAQSQPAATPTAREAAARAQLDLSGIHGTGPRAKVTTDDVELVHRTDGIAQPADLPAQVPLTTVRRRTAEKMSAAAHTTAAVTLTSEADATALVELRTGLNDRYQDRLGHSVSYNDVLVALVAQTLREFTYMNGRWTDRGVELLPNINIGVAVDTERGLLVPVVRDADKRSIGEIASRLHDLVARARAGTSLPDDLTGGSFTVTNLGMYDVDAFMPIINLPECAILGVGRVQLRPAVRYGQICARHLMYLSLTFDHRVVDGAPAARFLQVIKQRVERPYFLPM